MKDETNPQVAESAPVTASRASCGGPASERRWSFPIVVLAAVLSVGLPVCTGCREKGPVETAGEKVDEAVDNLKTAVDPQGPAERAGEKIDRALDH